MYELIRGNEVDEDSTRPGETTSGGRGSPAVLSEEEREEGLGREPLR